MRTTVCDLAASIGTRDAAIFGLFYVFVLFLSFLLLFQYFWTIMLLFCYTFSLFGLFYAIICLFYARIICHFIVKNYVLFLFSTMELCAVSTLELCAAAPGASQIASPLLAIFGLMSINSILTFITKYKYYRIVTVLF